MNTNKLLVLFVSALFCFNCNILHAQLGVRAGFTSSRIILKKGAFQRATGVKEKLNIRAHAGLVYGIKVTDNLLFEPGVIYNTKGGKVSLFKNGESIEASYTFHYLDVPLTAKYIFNLKKTSLYLQSGISFGLGLFDRERNPFIDENSSCQVVPNGPLYNRYDFTLIGGTGIIVNKKLHLGFTLNKSLTPVDHALANETKIRTFLPSLQVGATYFFIKESITD